MVTMTTEAIRPRQAGSAAVHTRSLCRPPKVSAHNPTTAASTAASHRAGASVVAEPPQPTSSEPAISRSGGRPRRAP